jgi:hypothetical protein
MVNILRMMLCHRKKSVSKETYYVSKEKEKCVERGLLFVKRDQRCVKRDLLRVKRDLLCVKRD